MRQERHTNTRRTHLTGNEHVKRRRGRFPQRDESRRRHRRPIKLVQTDHERWRVRTMPKSPSSVTNVCAWSLPV